MRLPQFQSAQVQSLGRASTGAVGRVAAARSGAGSAKSALLNHMAKVSSEFIRRDEKAKFDAGLSRSNISESQFIEKEGAKEFYSADELQGRVDDSVRLNDKETDADGNEITVPRKQIPAYEVYPQLLRNKLQGDMEAIAGTIPNPIDRQAFIESRSQRNAQLNTSTGLKAANEQYNYLRNESDVRRKQAILNGDIQTANFLATSFDGTEFEIKDRLVQNQQGLEVWNADELIRISQPVPEDVSAIKNMINYLQDDNYREKGGPLPERKNIDLQNRLRSRLGSLQASLTSGRKVYTAEIRRRGRDMISDMKNGILFDSESVGRMRGQLKGVGLDVLDIEVRRAEKISPVIDALYKMPVMDHLPMIDKMMGKDDSSDAEFLRRELIIISRNIQERINKDATGLYQERMSDSPNPNQPGFLSKSLKSSREASALYNIKAQPLSDLAASQFSRQFKFATISEKQNFIESVLSEVPEKADRDALFTQIDKKNAGNLNVYADIIERDEQEVIKAISEGKKLRNDKVLGLVPKDSDALINVELAGVFKLNTELQQYREAVKDYYAKLANDESEFNAESADPEKLSDAIKIVVGNIVEYDDRKFLLPNNELDANSFEDWIDDLDSQYIDDLGGVAGRDAKFVLQAVRDGDFTLHSSLTRGEYLVRDATEGYLMTATPQAGRSIPFRLVYDRNAPQKKTLSWFDFKQ